jgi:serine/threonine-protein kinase
LLDAAYQSEYVVQKFRQEVEALSRIDHPGIVGIVDAGELHNGRPFIVMQYVEGVTLRSVMNQEGMNLERIAGLLKVVSRALAAAHNRGIFHRDLKPDNIMLQDLGHGDEQVKIIDFGIAKVKNSVIAPSTTVNLSPGTVAYMAPEQLNGRPITAATDIFALGAIAYEMVTGRKPFNPETGFELLQLQQAGVRVKPVDLRPSLPLKAQDVILKALSYNPGDRQSTPREFGDQLAQAMVPDDPKGELPSGSPIESPATQLSSEVTPLARVAAVAPPDHIGAALPVALPAARRDVGERSVGKRRPRNWFGLLGGAGLIIAAIAVFTIWYLGRSRTEGTPPSNTDRVMNYGLTVQKVRSGQPYQEPFESSGQEIFENGWKFRISFTSPQSGYLYFLNEGPDVGGKVTYNMLFPAPSTNNGSPKVEAEQKIQTGWLDGF